ncbi:MAG: EAL domain-containing protein [Achromobacter sp.]|uniref:EAL domain-containing protein n=1 Tax=Achromobacter sp. TaxID=134375 RepID=UPI003CFEF935
MGKVVTTLVFTAGLLFAATVPIYIGLELLTYFAVQKAKVQAAALSEVMLTRADSVTRQLESVSGSLGGLSGTLPCASYIQAEMGRLVLQSPVLRAIAYTEDSRVICSSLGRSLDGTDLGTPDFVTAQGIRVWPEVVLPAAPSLRYIALARNGYTIFLNRGDLVSSAMLLEPAATLGLFYPGATNRFFGVGYVQPEWLLGAAGRRAMVTEVSGTVVALAPSSTFQHVALVAIPRDAYLHNLAATRWAVGVAGAMTGLMLCGLIVWRQRRVQDLAHHLRRAIKHREFYLAYQPIVDIPTGKWIGAEALLRWARPFGAEPIGPDVFIPAAERLGLSEEIAAQVFDLAARDIPQITSRVHGFYVSLNISANEARSGSGRDLVERLLQVTGIPPEALLIELTERGLLEANARETIRAIREMGVKVAIDDFGTGYSSLAYLGSFPVDYLKLDRVFTQGMVEQGPKRTVAIQIIDLARSLHLDVIAEGAENAEQVQAISQHGVTKVQGWYFERALSLDELIEALPVRGGRALRGGVVTQPQ